MKNLQFSFFTLICVTIFLTACGKESDCTEVSVGDPFEFQELDVICIDDKYELTINKVVDERCPCFANCIWEGEFLFKASLSDGSATHKIVIHEESMVTPPQSNPFDLNFINVKLITKDDCNDPIDLANLVFEMSVE